MNHNDIVNQLLEISAERKDWHDEDPINSFSKDITALDEAITIIAKDYVFGETDTLHPVPEHYQIKGLNQPSMEVIDLIVKHNTSDVKEACYLFMILKYLFRFGKKDGVKDLYKAKDFLDRLIEVREYENE